MNIVLFEDEFVSRLYPIVLSRPAFAISCGGARLVDVARRLADDCSSATVRFLVRPHLEAIVAEDFSDGRQHTLDRTPTLLLNARLVPSIETLSTLGRFLADGAPGIVRSGGTVAAALIEADSSARPGQWKSTQVVERLEGLQAKELLLDLPLLNYPHDVVRYHLIHFQAGLQARIDSGAYEQQTDGVFVADGTELGPYVTADTSAGPIVLERGARVGPYVYLSGPVLLGEKCRVNEHAAIKDHVQLGHTTKVGGEVEASIIEPYTNKQHHGFLGHSYLGSWINLGAGTCNSDLKNTYGAVKMEYGQHKIDTKMQFIGAMMGDYAKTAINTGIFTGKTIGVCSMLYGFVTTNVPSFVNYARSFGQVTETPADVLVATQARMFARRDVKQRKVDIELLHAMYDLTRHERQLAGEPLAL